jgi:hypothetical protein
LPRAELLPRLPRHRRLLIGSSWPLGILLGVAIASVGREFAQRHIRKKLSLREHWRAIPATLLEGLQRTLPVMLVVTFLLVPVIAMHIFKTFLCDPFEYAPNVTRRYLHDALDLDCDSDEYAATQSIALIAIVIWPLGVPLVYALLLWLNRDAILHDRPTALSRATTFLWEAYKPVGG